MISDPRGKMPTVGRKTVWSLRFTTALLTIAALTAIDTGMIGADGTRALAQSVKVGKATNTQRIKLGLNKSIVIDLPRDAYDVLVANPTVADAVTRTSRRIYLFGKQVGETNIFVFGPNGEQIANVDLVIERDVSGLKEHLARFIPNSDIEVELLNDNVVLTGTVETPLDASRAAQLAQIFLTGGEATTGNFTTSSGVRRRWRRGRDRQSRQRTANQSDRQPDQNHWRRPGYPQSDSRRSHPFGHEAARCQSDRQRLFKRYYLGARSATTFSVLENRFHHRSSILAARSDRRPSTHI